MDPASRARVEAWLRYGDHLGLSPYYRDRPAGQKAEPGVPPSIQVELSPARPPEVPAAPAPRQIHAPSPAQKPVPAPAALPLVAGPSLFDARIAGDTLDRIRDDVGPDCTRCKLHRSRTKIVFGVGNRKAELVFVGEGPGRDEDEQGEPFVGRAGKLLTQMIEAMSLRREDVYICNVVKCRPPENRLPEKDEIATCSPFLLRQLAVIEPTVICCLGSCAAQTLLRTTQGISRFRGVWFDFRGAKLIATYHPAYLLRNPNAKGEVWKDLQKVMAVLGLQPKHR
ncbi:MAG TPA: uracil-DNA glycosylase [Verrucomicrobiae bacterium]|jgi:uracil-DNA glycosylase family 4|nr:uracil-DNA glycosylase [Verrucomicrobiae bacterium]